MSCRSPACYINHGNVCINRNPTTRAIVRSLQEGGTPGLKLVLYVEQNTDFIINIFGFRQTDTPVLAWIGDINCNTLLFDKDYQLNKTNTLLNINFNSGTNNAIFVGLLFNNPKKNDIFVINRINIYKCR